MEASRELAIGLDIRGTKIGAILLSCDGEIFLNLKVRHQRSDVSANILLAINCLLTVPTGYKKGLKVPE